MKFLHTLLALALAASCYSPSLWAADAATTPAPAPVPANVDQQVLQTLTERLQAQEQNLGRYETLSQNHHVPNVVPEASHDFVLRLHGDIKVVTERHMKENILMQKDYFLHESRVYAYRVTRHDPCLDGKTKRVAESQFLLENGTPVYRILTVTRVPMTEEEPDLSKVPEKVLPIPSGLEGWGDALTLRAFDIARSFRSGIGRYAFGDWDGWVLKNAPPEGTELTDASQRPKDWLPAPDTLVLPVEDSLSPDGLFEIGWGYEKGPIDWKELACTMGGDSEQPYPIFSTNLADGTLTPEMENDSNFLLNHVSQKPLVNLGTDYPGERQRFNHYELLAHWSPSSACFVVRVDQKWSTEHAKIGWIKNGVCEGTYGILELLDKAAEAAVKKSKHPAAARMKKAGPDDEGYSFGLSQVLLEDNGQFEIHVVGQIAKDDLPSGLYEVIIEGTFSPGEKKDGDAILKVTKTRVLPPHENT